MNLSDKLIKLATLLKKAVEENPYVVLSKKDAIEEVFGLEERLKRFWGSKLKRQFLFDHFKTLPDFDSIPDQKIWNTVDAVFENYPERAEQIFRRQFELISDDELKKRYSKMHPNKLLILEGEEV